MNQCDDQKRLNRFISLYLGSPPYAASTKSLSFGSAVSTSSHSCTVANQTPGSSNMAPSLPPVGNALTKNVEPNNNEYSVGSSNFQTSDTAQTHVCINQSSTPARNATLSSFTPNDGNQTSVEMADTNRLSAIINYLKASESEVDQSNDHANQSSIPTGHVLLSVAPNANQISISGNRSSVEMMDTNHLSSITSYLKASESEVGQSNDHANQSSIPTGHVVLPSVAPNANQISISGNRSSVEMVDTNHLSSIISYLKASESEVGQSNDHANQSSIPTGHVVLPSVAPNANRISISGNRSSVELAGANVCAPLVSQFTASNDDQSREYVSQSSIPRYASAPSLATSANQSSEELSDTNLFTTIINDLTSPNVYQQNDYVNRSSIPRNHSAPSLELSANQFSTSGNQPSVELNDTNLFAAINELTASNVNQPKGYVDQFSTPKNDSADSITPGANRLRKGNQSSQEANSLLREIANQSSATASTAHLSSDHVDHRCLPRNTSLPSPEPISARQSPPEVIDNNLFRAIAKASATASNAYQSRYRVNPPSTPTRNVSLQSLGPTSVNQFSRIGNKSIADVPGNNLFREVANQASATASNAYLSSDQVNQSVILARNASLPLSAPTSANQFNRNGNQYMVEMTGNSMFRPVANQASATASNAQFSNDNANHSPLPTRKTKLSSLAPAKAKQFSRSDSQPIVQVTDNNPFIAITNQTFTSASNAYASSDYDNQSPLLASDTQQTNHSQRGVRTTNQPTALDDQAFSAAPNTNLSSAFSNQSFPQEEISNPIIPHGPSRTQQRQVQYQTNSGQIPMSKRQRVQDNTVAGNRPIVRSRGGSTSTYRNTQEHKPSTLEEFFNRNFVQLGQPNNRLQCVSTNNTLPTSTSTTQSTFSARARQINGTFSTPASQINSTFSTPALLVASNPQIPHVVINNQEFSLVPISHASSSQRRRNPQHATPMGNNTLLPISSPVIQSNPQQATPMSNTFLPLSSFVIQPNPQQAMLMGNNNFLSISPPVIQLNPQAPPIGNNTLSPSTSAVRQPNPQEAAPIGSNTLSPSPSAVTQPNPQQAAPMGNNTISPSSSAERQLDELHLPPTLHDLQIIQQRPKRPERALLHRRLETFTDWPADRNPTKEELADAGFFYAGQRDSVKCFFCGGGLRNWDPQDNAYVEHARILPKCPYIKQKVGQEFIDTVKRLAQHYMKISFQSVVDNMTKDKERFSKDYKKKSLLKDPAVEVLCAAGFSEVDVLAAAESVKSNGEISSSDILFEVLVERGVEPLRPIVLNDQGEVLGDSGPNESTLRDKEKVKEELKILKEKNQELRAEITCKVCMEQSARFVFLPCGHLVCCFNCACAMKDCPVCRMEIYGMVEATIA